MKDEVKMISKLLIANRGEIVCRIIRTCKNLNIKTVAVFSDADRNAFYLKDADETYYIGPSNPMKSYLNIDSIINTALKCNADAVHPGYGFLSENYSFAQNVISNGMVWVGPSPEVLKTVESKCFCRKIAKEADVPIIPGTLNIVDSSEEIESVARDLGFPILLKLDKGGGGQGIEKIDNSKHIEDALEKISRLGIVAFNSSDCYVEKALLKPRHIEVQFISDNYSNCICLGERECSIQRRNQKIIEESPSPIVSQADRESLYEYTKRLVGAMGYQGAGTMEFLRSENGNYYFMEINARLQVEHPVSEMITGVDIVENQLRIAYGEEIGFTQDDVEVKGHAIEARVYAEDPIAFQPSPGKITSLNFPKDFKHLRIDHALDKGSVIPPFYDPLLAKVIAYGSTRLDAIKLLKNALSDFNIEGIKTTIPANISILRSKNFVGGKYDTGLIEEMSIEGRQGSYYREMSK